MELRFNEHGVLPPRAGDEVDADRSPYPMTIDAFCRQFGSTGERRLILDGLLRLRADLTAEGFGGFQWINGSFTEDVETLRNRPPGDIDVVTFVPLGTREQQVTILQTRPMFFAHLGSKIAYAVDHYMEPTDKSPLSMERAHKIAYWYSMWAHQRDTDRWKGFVAIRLPCNDTIASAWLSGHNP